MPASRLLLFVCLAALSPLAAVTRADLTAGAD
jgi:hypothetical protein